MEILLSLLYTSLFIILIYQLNFFDVEGLSRKTISLFFVLKILSGLFVWFIYTYYYTNREGNDVFKFFDDAQIMFDAIYDHPLHYVQMVLGINTDAAYLRPYYIKMANWYKPWEGATYHNNRIIIQFNAFVHLFSFGYYNVHTVFMCFISLIGLTGIYKTFIPILKNKSSALAIAVFLIPSVLFWGSGLLKEGILLFALGMFIYSFFRFLFNKKSLSGFIWVIFSLVILGFTKIYVLLTLLPSLMVLVFIKRFGDGYLFIKFLTIHILLFLLAVNLYRVNPEWDVIQILRYKQWIFYLIATEEGAGSIIPVHFLEPSALSFIRNIPEALVNTLFRPHIFESKTLLMLISGLENLALLLLAFTSLIFFKKPEKEALPLLYTSVFFVISLALIIGMVNPVLGSIVRFRIPLLPFYAIIFILLLDKDKLLKKMPFLKMSWLGQFLKK